MKAEAEQTVFSPRDETDDTSPAGLPAGLAFCATAQGRGKKGKKRSTMRLQKLKMQPQKSEYRSQNNQGLANSN